MISKNFIKSLLITFIINYVAPINASVPCLDFMSISLENGQKTKNGSMIFGGLIFLPDTQFSDNGKLYGCPCKLKRCVRRCCMPGEFLDKICHKPEFGFYNFNVPPIPDGILDPIIDNFEEHFYVIYEKTCLSNNTYSIFASGTKKMPSDNFTITTDGILIIKNTENNVTITETFEQERYCIAWSEYRKGTKFLVCQNVEINRNIEINIVKEWIISVGNWFSAFFLILTFLVYSLFSKLRNIHGKTLMSYTASLTIAFIFLTIIKHREIQKYLVIGTHCVILGICYYFICACKS